MFVAWKRSFHCSAVFTVSKQSPSDGFNFKVVTIGLYMDNIKRQSLVPLLDRITFMWPFQILDINADSTSLFIPGQLSCTHYTSRLAKYNLHSWYTVAMKLTFCDRPFMFVQWLQRESILNEIPRPRVGQKALGYQCWDGGSGRLGPHYCWRQRTARATCPRSACVAGLMKLEGLCWEAWISPAPPVVSSCTHIFSWNISICKSSVALHQSSPVSYFGTFRTKTKHSSKGWTSRLNLRSKWYLSIRSVPQRKHNTSPLQRSTS
jgi:hypothetical protein